MIPTAPRAAVIKTGALASSLKCSELGIWQYAKEQDVYAYGVLTDTSSSDVDILSTDYPYLGLDTGNSWSIIGYNDPVGAYSLQSALRYQVQPNGSWWHESDIDPGVFLDEGIFTLQRWAFHFPPYWDSSNYYQAYAEKYKIIGPAKGTLMQWLFPEADSTAVFEVGGDVFPDGAPWSVGGVDTYLPPTSAIYYDLAAGETVELSATQTPYFATWPNYRVAYAVFRFAKRPQDFSWYPL